MTLEKITNKILQGDTLEVLKQMPDECIDMCITSPPYFGLRRYLDKDHPDCNKQIGIEDSFETYLERILNITKEIKRVLKKTGSFWLDMGDSFGGVQGRGEGIGNKKNQRISQSMNSKSKCMMMQPERLAIRMIDGQGWILRNKIKWAKQVLIYKEQRTIGGVMPTSVKDRFNESGEELYFFVKSKKYYFDLDAVRIKNQYHQQRKNKFNYRVRDAVHKEGQPQFKATQKEIDNYAPADHRGKNDVTEKNYGLKNCRQNEAKQQGMHLFYTHSKRFKPGEYQGKFAGKEDAEMFNSPRARTQRKRKSPEELKATGVTATYIGATGEDHNLLNNPTGKNIPTIWQINTEPHNFSKEFFVDTDHFASFPEALCEIPIKSGCPERICKKCGKISERITEKSYYKPESMWGTNEVKRLKEKTSFENVKYSTILSSRHKTVGWTDCGCGDGFEGGIVLDTFGGSGTVAVVAKRLKRNFVLIELNKKYIDIARARISKTQENLL